MILIILLKMVDCQKVNQEDFSNKWYQVLIIVIKSRSRSVFTLVHPWRSIGIPLKLTDRSIISRRLLPILLRSFVASLIQIGFGIAGTRNRTQYLLIHMFNLVECFKIHLSLFCNHLDALFKTPPSRGESVALLSWESKVSIGGVIEVSVSSIPFLGFLCGGQKGRLLAVGILVGRSVEILSHKNIYLKLYFIGEPSQTLSNFVRKNSPQKRSISIASYLSSPSLKNSTRYKCYWVREYTITSLLSFKFGYKQLHACYIAYYCGLNILI